MRRSRYKDGGQIHLRLGIFEMTTSAGNVSGNSRIAPLCEHSLSADSRAWRTGSKGGGAGGGGGGGREERGMLIGTIDVYHLIPLSMTLAYTGGPQGQRKAKPVWLYFLVCCSSDQAEI